MTRVNTGIKFEYQMRDYFKALGYEVIRSAGSKGAADLIVWKDNLVELIQCKKGNSPLGADKTRLRALKTPLGWKRRIYWKRDKDVQVLDVMSGQSKSLSISEINKVIKNGRT